MKKLGILFIISMLGISISSYSSDYQFEDEFQTRKDTLYNIIATKYYCWNDGSGGFQPCDSRPPGFGGIGSGDPFQYMAPIMGVIYETEGVSGTANSDLANDKLKNHLTDYDLFHFNYPGVTKLIMEYPNCPAVEATKESWIQNMFNRTDSYNGFYGEGTENHLFMSRLPAYLLCDLAVDSFPSQFPEASKWRDSLKNYIMDVSKRMYSSGLGEFNSSIYQGYTAEGWLVLYDYAKDQEVKKAAKAALDYIALEIALHWSQGINAGGDLRGKRITTSLETGSSMAWLGWLWYGNVPRSPKNVASNFTDAQFAQSYYAASSSYRPPEMAVKLAKKELTVPAMYHNSKGKYLMNDPGSIKQTLYIGKDFSMGAAYLPYGGWSGAEWQTLNWKLISRVDSGADKSAQFASGLGMQYFSGGKCREPFDQFAHHKNVLVQMTRVPSNVSTIKNNIESIFNQWADNWDTDFVQRFSSTDTKITSVNNGITASSGRTTPISFQDYDVSDGDSYIDIFANGSTLNVDNNSSDNVFYAELEKTYLAIRSINNDNPTYNSGTLTDNTSSLGVLTGFVLEVRDQSDYTSFDDFKNEVRNNTSIDKSKVSGENRIIYVSTHDDTMNVQYQTSGSFTQPIYDWGYGPQDPLVIPKEPPFQQPDWPSGEGHGKIASWSVNGQQVDLSSNWGVYNGPNVNFENEILYLEDNSGNFYQADYTGDVPVFSSNVTNNNSIKTSLSKEKGFSIYPNPAENKVTIKGGIKGEQMELISTSGKVLNKRTLTSNNEKVSLNELNKGVYIIKIGSISKKLYIQ